MLPEGDRRPAPVESSAVRRSVAGNDARLREHLAGLETLTGDARGPHGEVDHRATFKPRDVEEPFDYLINRPLASILVKALAKTRISPNQVTAMSGLVGLASGIVVGTAPLGPSLQIPIGGLLLFVSILLDCADGQLARLRGQSSMMGRALDGYVDVIPTASMFLGFAWFLFRAGYDWRLINLLGWSAGYSMKWQAHSYDHAKNIFLHNTLPPEKRAQSLPTQEEIEAERQRHLARGERFSALIVRGFGHLTKSQRRGFQKQRMGLGLPGTETERERLLYRLAFNDTMRIWRWNGLASHLYCFLLVSLATPFYAGSELALCAFFIGPVNLVTAYLFFREKGIEQRLQAKIRTSPRDA